MLWFCRPGPERQWWHGAWQSWLGKWAGPAVTGSQGKATQSFSWAPTGRGQNKKDRCHREPPLWPHNSPHQVSQIHYVLLFLLLPIFLFGPCSLCKTSFSQTHSLFTFQIKFWHCCWLSLWISEPFLKEQPTPMMQGRKGCVALAQARRSKYRTHVGRRQQPAGRPWTHNQPLLCKTLGHTFSSGALLLCIRHTPKM